jgi:hypothetical protein
VTSDEPRAARAAPRDEGPEDARQALARAARHARAAAAEAVLAIRALLDAAALVSSGSAAEAHAALRGAAHWLDAVARGVAPDGGRDAALAQALAEALDAEIDRWQLRAAQDPEARAVLRAFLGVRELLWELGVRPPPPGTPERPTPAPAKHAPRRKRVERVRVQG